MNSTQKPIQNILKLLFLAVLTFSIHLSFSKKADDFKVIAFYTGKNDPAHVSFVKEANQWFAKMGEKHNFQYNSTNDWNNMNAVFLSEYDVVVFLDTRPDALNQRLAFQNYMENGGAWLGFHFCAFALTSSDYPQNWEWYHNTFLGSGQYKSNTWRPTSAILKVEDQNHPATKNLPEQFTTSPNEWYCWENDLRENPDIKILASIDSSSFPLGTGPKLDEIWHSGYYPVVWSNINYRMIYLNMGHNDIDYESGTNKELSCSFKTPIQNKLVIDALKWLGSN